MKTSNQSGQAFIEALVVSFLFFILISSLCCLAYHNIASHWLRQKVYESGLCIVMHGSQSDCKNLLQTQTKNLFPFGKITKINYNFKKNKSLKINCTYSIAERLTYEIEHKIDLPLPTKK